MFSIWFIDERLLDELFHLQTRNGCAAYQCTYNYQFLFNPVHDLKSFAVKNGRDYFSAKLSVLFKKSSHLPEILLKNHLIFRILLKNYVVNRAVN